MNGISIQPSVRRKPRGAEVPLVEIEGLFYEIDGRVILEQPYWSFRKGEHSLVIGPSGSGKTSLLNLMAGLLTPNRGRIRISVQDIAALDPPAMDRFRGRHIGMVFQKLYLLPALTVMENLMLSARLARIPFDRPWAEEILRSLRLHHLAHRRPESLSFGEAQRAAIARAVLKRPKLILADEPTSALDDENCRRVAQTLVDQAARGGATLVVATHDVRLKAYFTSRLDLEVRD